MSLIKFFNLVVTFIVAVALYNLFFSAESKNKFAQLQKENKLLLEETQLLAEENSILESSIQSRQKNDAHAEKFAREELNLIFEGEQYLSFEEINTDEPKR